MVDIPDGRPLQMHAALAALKVCDCWRSFKGSYWWGGFLASGYALGLSAWKLWEDAAKWAWDPPLINLQHMRPLSLSRAQHADSFPLSLSLIKPTVMNAFLCPPHSRTLLSSLICICLCAVPLRAYKHPLHPKSSCVSPLCGECNRRSEGFPWVSRRVRPYLN